MLKPIKENFFNLRHFCWRLFTRRLHYPPRRLIDVGEGSFDKIGREFADYFRNLAGLQPHERVLDIGCGAGRMAYPLLDFIQPPGFYEGIDVMREPIEWCQRKITPRYPHFRFTHADLHNPRYNPGGTHDTATYRLPYPDQSFDFIVMTSVLTHLLPPELDHYLDEVARLLEPGKRCLLSFYLLNAEQERYAREGRSWVDFTVDRGDYQLFREDIPEVGVAYPEERVREALANRGLFVRDPVFYGSWAGRPHYTSFQDVIIADKGKQS